MRQAREEAERLRDKNRQQSAAIAELSRRDRQYPLVAFESRLAQGVARIPGARGKHFEFFREENRFCVIMDFHDAEGLNPRTLVPSFLEIDETQQVTSTIDSYGIGGGKRTNTIIYKIPIRGWDDSVIVLDDIDQQGVFGLDGKAIERSRPFTCPGLNVHGFFRREDAKDGWWCNCYFFFEEIGNRKAKVLGGYLPPGLFHDGNRQHQERAIEGQGPKMIHFRIPIHAPEQTRLAASPKRASLPRPKADDSVVDAEIVQKP